MLSLFWVLKPLSSSWIVFMIYAYTIALNISPGWGQCLKLIVDSFGGKISMWGLEVRIGVQDLQYRDFGPKPTILNPQP